MSGMYEYEFTDSYIDELFVTIEILTVERNELYYVCNKLSENPKTKGSKEYKDIRDKLVAHNIAIESTKMRLDRALEGKKKGNGIFSFQFKREEKKDD